MDDKRDSNVNFDIVESHEDKSNEESKEIEYRNKESKKKKGFKGSFISYIAIALVASIIGGLVATYMGPSLFASLGLPDTSKVYAVEQINIETSDDVDTVSAVVRKALPTVVGITTVETQSSIFGDLNREGLGSGVIVDSDGYILTNSHVIANGNANKITVLFEDGEQVSGEVLWHDSTLDLAVVKVGMTNLPVAELGDSDSLEVGELAVAIGNPLGLEFQRTVTSGIISGLNRSIQVDQSSMMEDLIQTDASINSGNSGGPLLNKHGQVIGINTAKVQTAEGLGFSIPINSAKVIIEEVINKGTFETVQMGVSVMDIDEFEARLGIDLEIEDGIVVVKVEPNSAADKAGLVVGDIIVEMDEDSIDSTLKLKKMLFKYKVGDKATLSIIRNQEEMLVDIEFIKMI